MPNIAKYDRWRHLSVFAIILSTDDIISSHFTHDCPNYKQMTSYFSFFTRLCLLVWRHWCIFTQEVFADKFRISVKWWMTLSVWRKIVRFDYRNRERIDWLIDDLMCHSHRSRWLEQLIHELTRAFHRICEEKSWFCYAVKSFRSNGQWFSIQQSINQSINQILQSCNCFDEISQSIRWVACLSSYLSCLSKFQFLNLHLTLKYSIKQGAV